jgi:small-conductance mechanosensitive channel
VLAVPFGAQSHEAATPNLAPATPVQPAPKWEPVPVLLDGKIVIEVQWGFGNVTPTMRANGISARLEKMAEDTSQPATLTTSPTEMSVDVMAGDHIMASVFDGDAKAAGVSRELLARSWQDAFTRAIKEYRHEHGPAKVSEHIALTALIVAVTFALLWLLIPVTRWAADRTSRWVLGRMGRVRRQSLSLIDRQQLDNILRMAFRIARLALSVFVLYVAFQLLFLIFPETRPLGTRMREGVLGPLWGFGREVWASTPSLIFIAIIAIACRYALQLISFAFSRIDEGHVRIEGFKPHWAAVTSRLVSIGLIVLAVLIAYPYIPGSQSPAFKGFSLFLGVLVSLGSTGVVANVLNGIVLTYMDAFRVGDYIRIGETEGYVETTSLFVTRLKTRQGRVVTIPNSAVLSNEITNYSHAAGDKTLSLSATAGIGYDTPWRQVEAMLLNAAKKTPTVREAPAPYVLEVSLDSFQITYELIVFLTGERSINSVRAELNRNILDQFNEYGVQIMTPSYEADPAKPLVVEKRNWYAAPSVKDGSADAQDLEP